MTVEQLGRSVHHAAVQVNQASAQQKNKALEEIRTALLNHKQEVLDANQKDIARAKENQLSAPLIDRLLLNEERIAGMADGIQKLFDAQDPVGRTLDGFVRPNGLRIQKVTVPIGTIGIIFEARPNVCVDAASLCLKAGNAVLLRGGKEAICSNCALVALMQDAIARAGFPKETVALVEDTTRESAAAMMKLTDYLDALIPRGGRSLIRTVVENATVPVIETGSGNCHIYVDRDASVEMAVRIVDNAKTSRPSVCNAAETLLVHKDIAPEFLPAVALALQVSSVVLYGCKKTQEILKGIEPATEEAYQTEFLDYKMAVRVVEDEQEAIDHIAQYSSGHSEAIITNSLSAADAFVSKVDAAAVYVNASTRFTDGGEFGYGAEIGISTQKLHARGPMGLNELTTYKYIIRGDGQIR